MEKFWANFFHFCVSLPIGMVIFWKNVNRSVQYFDAKQKFYALEIQF